MKKTLVVTSLVVLLAAVSCVKENQFEETEDIKLVYKEFAVVHDDSKTALAADGKSLVWSADDQVSVWDGVANRKFSVKECDGASAVLSGMVAESATDFYAVYPYSDQLTVSAPDNAARDIRIRVPFTPEQTAVDGSFAPTHALAVSKAVDGAFSFINRNALLKFELAEDMTGATAIKLKSAANYLTGIVNFEWAGNTVYQGIAADKGYEITLNAPNDGFKVGVTYYIVAPSTNHSQGVSVTACFADGTSYTRTSTKALALNSGKIVPLSSEPLTKSMFETYNSATGYFKSYIDGQDVTICGKAYNQASNGTATFIKSGETATISAGGIYFIDPQAVVTIATSKLSDVVLVGNDPSEQSSLTFSGFALNKDADVSCLNVELAPVASWPSGRDIVNETTTSGDLRFENCHIYHPKNARYLVYAGMSGTDLAPSIASLSLKDCVYTIQTPASKAYLLNCPLEGTSIEFDGNTFHCQSESDVATQFKLISLNNKSQTINSLKINNNDFVNCNASSAGTGSFVTNNPLYKYVEVTNNVSYQLTLNRNDYIVGATDIESGIAYGNCVYESSAYVFNAFHTAPEGVVESEAMSQVTSSPYLSMDYLNGVFERDPKVVMGDGGYDIYLLIGQSNAAGRGYLLDADKTTYLDGVMQWNPATQQMQQAIQPLNLLSTVRKKAEVQRFNLAGPFASKIYQETGRKVLLVVNARGETLISAWMKEEDGGKSITFDADRDDEDKVGQTVWLNDEAVKVTKQALKYGTLKGIIWHQGCGNSSEGNTKSYLGSLKKVVDGLREDLGAPDVPFVAGQLAPDFANSQYFNPMILTIGNTIDNAFCATSEDCITIDNTHFDRNSLITMGERYADIILEQVYGK